VLLGMAVGTGFAVVETFGYIMDSSREAMLEYIGFCLDNGRTIYYADVLEAAYASGLDTAILRSVNGVVGHGVYAALYGGGLLMAKGEEPVSSRHLLHKDFLKYFAASVVIHTLNNSGIRNLFPWIIEGKIMSWSLVKIALGALFLLPLMKTGVNQVVRICAARNHGRVTLAVNREINDPVPDMRTGAAVGRLDFLSGPLAGQSFALREGQQIIIGRSHSCSVPIVGASSISGRHCSVSLDGGMVLVTDLGSTNGTYLGGKPLTAQRPTPIPDGGVVYLGNKNCAFRVSSR